MCNYELSCCEWSFPSLPKFLCKTNVSIVNSYRREVGSEICGYWIVFVNGAIWGLLQYDDAFGKNCLRYVSTKLHLDSAIWLLLRFSAFGKKCFRYFGTELCFIWCHLSLFLGFSAFEKKCFKYVNVELKWCHLSPLEVPCFWKQM